MAWLLGEIRASATQTQPDGSERQISYRCSWLQIYTRHNGHWAAIVNAPSIQIESEEQRGSTAPMLRCKLVDPVDFPPTGTITLNCTSVNDDRHEFQDCIHGSDFGAVDISSLMVDLDSPYVA